MKKLILFTLILLGISTFSYSQKPMIGYTKEDIININLREFGIYNYKIETLEDNKVWIMYSEHATHSSVYYFEFNNNRNILFSHFIKDLEFADIIYENIKMNCTRLGDLFFLDKNGLYIYIGYTNSGQYTFTWSDKIIEGLILR